VTRFGDDRPTKCVAFDLIINVATTPNRPPIKIDPIESGIGEFNKELALIELNAIMTPMTEAVSSSKTTFKLGSALA
jgi:hypothetical protein